MKAKILKIDYLENTIEFGILGALNGLKHNDLFELKKVRRKRTLDQNSLYWMFCDYVGMNLYMTKEEVHEGFKEKHLQKIKILPDGREWKTKEETKLLNSFEFGNYIDKCNLTALEFGVNTSEFWEEYEKFKK